MWAYNHSMNLEHHGIKGQRWGVRRYQSADGSLTAAGKKRYDKKVKRGSLHNVIGLALENQGMKKAADRHYKKGEYQEAKWSAKANMDRRLKEVYNSYIKDLQKLDKSGRGNDIEAIVQRSELYDSQVALAKSQYKAQILQAKKIFRDLG